MNTLFKKVLTLAAYVTMIFVNYLAVTLPLAGRSTGAISDSYPNLFAPAGFTFSIWGLIYLLLGMYVIYQFTRQKDSLVVRINQIFSLNAVLNAIWIFTWHYNIIWLSVVIMLGLLGTLIAIAELIHTTKLTNKEKWFIRLPFSVYFGWITVATIANITVFLVSIGWDGFGFPKDIWTVIILVVGAAIGFLRILRDRSVSYGMVLCWAYGGIVAKHISQNGFAGRYPNIMITGIFCIFVFAMTIFFVLTNVQNHTNTIHKRVKH